MLKTWLKKKGIQTDSASTISSAKNMIIKGNYDLILLDLRLPDGNGIDLLEWRKQKQIEKYESRAKRAFSLNRSKIALFFAWRFIRICYSKYPFCVFLTQA